MIVLAKPYKYLDRRTDQMIRGFRLWSPQSPHRYTQISRVPCSERPDSVASLQLHCCGFPQHLMLLEHPILEEFPAWRWHNWIDCLLPGRGCESAWHSLLPAPSLLMDPWTDRGLHRFGAGGWGRQKNRTAEWLCFYARGEDPPLWWAWGNDSSPHIYMGLRNEEQV